MVANLVSKSIRVFQTVKHLSAEQWGYRLINRGERIIRARFPRAAFDRVLRLSATLPEPDLDAPGLNEIVDVVRLLHTSIHGEHVARVSEGVFTFLNRTVDFGSLGELDWRKDLGEGNNRLWLMNLGYFGWSIPFVERGGANALAQVADVIANMEAQNGFHVPGVFGDVWNAYTASHRLISLFACLSIYKRKHGPAEASAYAKIMGHIIFCAAFVSKSLEKELQYNHLLKNYVALAVYCAACPRGADVFPFLERAVVESVRQQVLSDGGHSERSPMYNVLSYLDLTILSSYKAYPSWSFLSEEVIPKMAAALRVQSHPDGDIALFNDSWLGEAPSVDAILGSCRVSSGKWSLVDTGYTKLADDASSAVVFDHGLCGPDDNPGHAHADFLSVELSVEGARFIVDPGTPTYSSGALRDISRSASEHNGPSFRGIEPIDFWSSFRVGRRGRARLVNIAEACELNAINVAGTHDGYRFAKSGVGRHVLLFPRRGALLIDVWWGPAGGAQSKFLVHSSWALEAGHSFRRGEQVVSCEAIIGDLSSPENGDAWPRFAAREAVTAFALEPEAHDGFRAASLWFGWNGQCPVTAYDAIQLARALVVASGANVG